MLYLSGFELYFRWVPLLINIFVSLHNIFMPNKIYLYLCMIIMPTENAMKLIELPKIYTTE